MKIGNKKLHVARRYFYIGLLAIIVVIAAVFFYRTSSTVLPAKSMAKFGDVSLRIEYAITPEDKRLGLSGRTEIPDDYGMLFIFPEEGMHGIWMKDMLVPIDIFWLDSNRHTVSIISDIATSTYPNVFYPTRPARYVLETAAGFARANNIATGTPLLLKNFPIISK